jgi:hypothetical protein
MFEIDTPACPHCGSLRVTAVRAPQLISGSGGYSAMQTRDYAWQCVCGAVFTVPLPESEGLPSAAASSCSEQLRRGKPR